MGSVYQRKLASGKLGPTWWIKYHVGGRPVRESAQTTKVTEARRLLQEREGKVATGEPILRRADKVTYQDAATDLRAYYAASGTRDLAEAEFRLAHLDRFFGRHRLAAIGGADVTAYALARQEAGAANGTINREIATLSRMLRLAYEHGKLARLPVLRRLKENAPRAGFFERAEFESVRKHLPVDLQLAISLAYTYGWRMQSEVLTLTRAQVDLAEGTVRLDPGLAKNDEPRTIYLTPEHKSLLAAQLDRVKALERRLGRVIPAVFPHLAGRSAGQPRHEFRKRWATACIKAGLFRVEPVSESIEGGVPATRKVPTKLLHDFRRSAARNLVRRGVPERVAMSVTGHKTRSVFDRYNIVSDGDLREAARRLAGTV